MKKLLFSFLILLISFNVHAVRERAGGNWETAYEMALRDKISRLTPTDEVQFVYPVPKNADINKVFSSMDLFIGVRRSFGSNPLNSQFRNYAITLVAGTFNGSKDENAALLKTFAVELIKKLWHEWGIDDNFKNTKIIPLLDSLKSFISLGLVELKREEFIDDWAQFKNSVLDQLKTDVTKVHELNAQGKLSSYQREKLIMVLSSMMRRKEAE